MDPFLLVAELACLGFVVFALGHLAKACIPASVGYTDLITACQTRGISVAETFCCITFFLGFLVFDIFVTLAEDDILEGVSYVFVSIIALAGLLLVAAVDVQYYYMISSISGGELTLRVLYADLVANALCLLRVFFCWVRYLFYDLQGELVDLTFFYTELPEEGLLALNLETHVGPGFSWSLLALVTAAIVTTFFDGVALLLQLFVSLFKLALALFLFWLILDLFLLRTFARVESRWSLLRGKRKV